MNQTILIRMVMLRLLRFPLKSFFMGLGVLLSVASIILVQTIGGTIRERFTRFIHETYPANTLYLAGGNGFMGGGSGAENLRMPNIQAVLESVHGIDKWDPIVFAGTKNVTSATGSSAYVAILGHSETAESVRNRSVEQGVFFSAEDVRQGKRIAMIGKHAASVLFGTQDPIGQKVFFNSVALEIVGVLASAGVDPHGNDLDNELHLPYTLLKDKILQRNYVSAVTFVIADDRVADMDGVARDIGAVMRRQHNLSDDAKNDFTVIHSGAMMKMVDRAYRTFDVFFPIITTVAFLISSILILAIMVAVVKERTREIGLRKALGATPLSLRCLILLEVLAVALLGALLGVILAQVLIHFLTPTFAAMFGITRLAMTLPTVAGSIGLALLAGLLGALLPAARAARIDPVLALAS